MAKLLNCADCKWVIPKQGGHARLCGHPKTMISAGSMGKMKQTTSSARWDNGASHKCGGAAQYFEAATPPNPGEAK